MNRLARMLFVALAAAGICRAQAESGVEFFERRVRPLLVDHCYECHADKKQKGGLRLDSAAGLRAGGDSGPVIEPGDPGKSRLMAGLSWDDPDFQMPPKNRLTDAAIAVLAEWIRMGAPDPRTNAAPVAAKPPSAAHWSYQPLTKSQAPKSRRVGWAQTDIDEFIVAELEKKGVKPAADATRPALLRRASYDLTGLPPSPSEIDAFVNDASPDAFTTVIDRLLASPRFGERWGRHWLDVARYGESVTLRGLVYKEAWRYRDYVIEAFNSDTPYDQFIREQIAGDLLPGASFAERQRRIPATTFLALGNTNLEEQDKKQLRMDVVDEQLDTIGKAFLAQTIGCARCHDHKFDPIPTRDYYAMAGILQNVQTLVDANVSSWIEIPLPVTPEQEAIFQEHESRIAALELELKSAREKAKTLAGKSAETAGQTAAIAAADLPGVVVDSAQAKPVGAWKLSQYTKTFVGDGYLHDENSGKGEKTLTFQPELKAGKYEVRLAYSHAPSRATNVPVTVFHADGETVIHVNQQNAPILEGRFVSLGVFPFEKSGFAHVLVSTDGTLGYVTADAVQFLPSEIPVAENRSAENGQQEKASLDTVKSLEVRLKKLRDTGPKRPRVMSVKELGKGSSTRVHIRGSVHNLGAEVPRGFLQVAQHGPAPIMPADQSGRRELADWIASPDNPLTARVMVNRVWHWLFSQGLVRTTDNFGTTGEEPSHPDLLDYLAHKFMDEGWSVKRLIREVMLSRTYQLAVEEDHPSDPENRLFGRAGRKRLDAESIRDTILQVSGELSLEMGGSAIPEGLTSDFTFTYNGNRRSVYVPALRNALPEIFEVFDFADPSMVTGNRNVSTVAPQALFLLNHVWVKERSSIAARRFLGMSAPDDRARLRGLYLHTLGRSPTSGEERIGLRFISSEPDREAAWSGIVQALFASVDFRYLN